MAKVDITSEMTGSIWKIMKAIGDKVAEGDTVILIEAMKMEIPVIAPEDGVIAEILVQEGNMVADGDLVMRLEK